VFIIDFSMYKLATSTILKYKVNKSFIHNAYMTTRTVPHIYTNLAPPSIRYQGKVKACNFFFPVVCIHTRIIYTTTNQILNSRCGQHTIRIGPTKKITATGTVPTYIIYTMVTRRVLLLDINIRKSVGHFVQKGLPANSIGLLKLAISCTRNNSIVKLNKTVQLEAEQKIKLILIAWRIEL
jgi:hypothetical protein